MIHRCAPPAFIAAVSLTLCAGSVAAQTAIVKGLPAGTSIELVLNGTAVGTATVAAEGLGTVTVPEANAVAAQTSGQVFVDRCGDARRVVIVERGRAAAPAGGCLREAIPGFYVLRSETTFVVDLTESTPRLLIAQGRAPESWLQSAADAAAAAASMPLLAPAGLVVFGGAGLARFTRVTDVACGTVTSCTGDANQPSYAVGAAYWFGPFVAAEAQYISPGTATAAAEETAFRFDSEFRTRLMTLAGQVGGPVGRVRLYGRAGVNRHGAALRTTQTIDPVTVTAEDGTQTVSRGGTQTLELRTEGWGLLVGGGGEVWLSRWVALYGDLNRAALKGSALDVPEGAADDVAWLVQIGGRVRIGR